MSLPEEYKRLVEKRVEACYETAQDYFARQFLKPDVLFKQRGKIAGSARLQTNQLNFNPVLLEDNLDHFIDVVVPHEVSHLLVHQLYGRVRPHGFEWQQIMRNVFEQKANVRHRLDVSKVSGKTFEYQCACATVSLSIRRHNKVLRNQQQYLCRKCGDKLIQKINA